jgi:REP element-mobilizing transposase RayT
VPRPFRLEYPGACWHIHNRGVERRGIFLDDDDRRFFLTLLGEVAIEYKWRVFSYAEMTNHYHGFIQTIEPTLSRGMQALDGDFAARFNRRHRRCGPLFQGRFRAHLVEQESEPGLFTNLLPASDERRVSTALKATLAPRHTQYSMPSSQERLSPCIHAPLVALATNPGE